MKNIEKNKKIDKLVKESYSNLKKAINNKKVGIPVVATVINCGVGDEFLLSKYNIKTKHGKHDPLSHAEFLLLNEMIERDVKGDFYLFVNILPCKECYEKIIECKKNGINIKEIFYINNYKEDKKINYYKSFEDKIDVTLISSSLPENSINKKLKYIYGIFNSYISYTYIIRVINDWLGHIPEDVFFIEIPSEKYSNNYEFLKIISEEVKSKIFEYDDNKKCFIVNAIFLRFFWFLNKNAHWKKYKTNEYYENFDRELIEYSKNLIKNIREKFNLNENIEEEENE